MFSILSFLIDNLSLTKFLHKKEFAFDIGKWVEKANFCNHECIVYTKFPSKIKSGQPAVSKFCIRFEAMYMFINHFKFILTFAAIKIIIT